MQRVPANSDEAALQRAAVRVGVQIAAAVAVVVVLMIAAAAIFVAVKSQPAEVVAHLSHSGPQIVLDPIDVFGALIVGGIAGIVLAGIVGVFVARQAVRPLGESLALQRSFVQDASHELRTPLTVIDTRIQLAQRRLGPDSDAAGVLAELRGDSAKLAAVIEDLLHAVSGGPDIPETPTDLGSIARDVVRDLSVLAAERGISLAADAPTIPVPVAVDPAPLRRVIVALADNALKYTPDGGRVTVGVRVAGGTGTDRRSPTAVLTVADTGPGIAGSAPERVFERYAGGGTASHTGRRSFGLGLALVRDIAVRNGGAVRIASTGAGGTTMEVTLPLAEATPRGSSHLGKGTLS
ncbi:sensor histidine kinase [Sinomonas sp. P10A9]|uniref:histidine kinase n=1 Tax=Sinomonas puerhi TaxID=3238584 RepID=A0AB39L764_9MICC